MEEDARDYIDTQLEQIIKALPEDDVDKPDIQNAGKY